MRLGAVSSTGDPEGSITPVSKAKPSQKDIAETAKSFTGQIKQTPPAFSAVKVGGKRAYKLAREGKEVKIEPREVTVHSLELIHYDYPNVKLVADVSSGTYIRSLVEDIGQALGTGAYTNELRRTRIGDFSIEGAKALNEVNADNFNNI